MLRRDSKCVCVFASEPDMSQPCIVCCITFSITVIYPWFPRMKESACSVALEFFWSSSFLSLGSSLGCCDICMLRNASVCVCVLCALLFLTLRHHPVSLSFPPDMTSEKQREYPSRLFDCPSEYGIWENKLYFVAFFLQFIPGMKVHHFCDTRPVYSSSTSSCRAVLLVL